MFQYIQKLRAEGPQEWVFQECKVLLFCQNFSYGKFSRNKYMWVNLNVRPSEIFKVFIVPNLNSKLLKCIVALVKA